MPTPRTSSWMGYRELFLLWVRRSLDPAWVLPLLGLLSLLSLADWTPNALRAGGSATPQLVRGLERQALWSVALLLLTVWTTWHGARIMWRWREGEWNWIASRPVTTFRVWIATWTGASAGLGLLLVAMGVVVEIGAGMGAPTERLADSQAMDDTRLEPGQSIDVPWLGAAPTAGSLRVFLRSSPGGDPATDVVLEARRGESIGRTELRLDGPRPAEVELPSGPSGPVTMTISNTGTGALAVDGGRPMEWWKPAGSEWLGSCNLIWRAFLGLSALLGLAMGFGGRMGAVSAAGLAGACLLIATSNPPVTWVPFSDLPSVLTVLGEGRLPGGAHLLLPWVTVAVGLGSWWTAGKVQ